MKRHTPLIDWVDASCRLWGMQIRHRLEKKERYPQSFSGKLVEEGPGAVLGHQNGSHEVEGLTGQARDIGLAILVAIENRRLTYRQYQILHKHYVERGSVKCKAPDLNMCEARYYQLLGAAHRNLAEVMA